MSRPLATTRRNVGALVMLLSPCLVWAQPSPSGLTIFGKPTDTWIRPPDQPPDWEWTPPTVTTGIPLTCTNASDAISQWNSGKYAELIEPGMQVSGWDDSVATTGSYTPDWNLPIRGLSAQYVPSATTANWAAPPTDSKWIYMAWENDLYPPLDIAYLVAIYIPTAEDAAKMQVTMQYRAQSELRGIYRNEFPATNLLAQPIAGTSAPGSAAQSISLNSGWRQGDNYLTITVRGVFDPDTLATSTGFAARFTAGCATPPVTAVPTTDASTLVTMALSLLGLGAYARRRRKSDES